MKIKTDASLPFPDQTKPPNPQLEELLLRIYKGKETVADENLNHDLTQSRVENLIYQMAS
jgi:hypothetical protein